MSNENPIFQQSFPITCTVSRPQGTGERGTRIIERASGANDCGPDWHQDSEAWPGLLSAGTSATGRPNWRRCLINRCWSLPYYNSFLPVRNPASVAGDCRVARRHWNHVSFTFRSESTTTVLRMCAVTGT